MNTKHRNNTSQCLHVLSGLEQYASDVGIARTAARTRYDAVTPVLSLALASRHRMQPRRSPVNRLPGQLGVRYARHSSLRCLSVNLAVPSAPDQTSGSRRKPARLSLPRR